jgi:flagellar biosynthesis protein FlgN
MSRKAAFVAMRETIDVDRKRCAELKQLLDQQFDAGLRRDGASLMAVASAIQVCVDALQSSHAARCQWARVLAAPHAPGSMAQLCDTLRGAPRDTLSSEWQALDALMRECQRLNQRNATLLMSQFEIVQRALHGEADTYVRP